jgi:biuret amidohydrolase
MNINNSVLLLIDFQKELKYELVNLESVKANAGMLLKCCREKGVPVIYTRQVNRADGACLPFREPLDENGEPFYYHSGTKNIEIFDEICPAAGDVVIDKHRWSGFFETDMDSVLKNLNAKHLIIGGLVTDGCLMTTVFDAFFRDYQVHLVKDISTTTSIGAHMSSIMIMCNWVNGIEVYDTREMIRRMEGKPYKSWKWTGQDSFRFDEKNMARVFEKTDEETVE